MNAGTFNLAMMTPLTSPTAAAPPTPAMRPTRTAGKRGAPPLNAARKASAERTEARLITQPTERSMPAPMMTKVWPRPSRSTGMMATRMFWELRTVKKLTEPPVVSGTATTKNRTRSAEEEPGPDAAEEQEGALRRRADPRGRGGRAGKGQPRGALGHLAPHPRGPHPAHRAASPASGRGASIALAAEGGVTRWPTKRQAELTCPAPDR